jgi:hypothetical protein
VIYARRILGVVCGVAVLSCILACGAVKQAQQAAKDSMDLVQLGQSYHAFANDGKNKGRGPANADEWIKWAQATPGQGDAVALIQQTKPGGKYTIYWNVNIGALGGKSNTTVLGYDNKLPGAVGVVLMADGSVRAMQPAEFNAATKPPKDGGDKK